MFLIIEEKRKRLKEHKDGEVIRLRRMIRSRY
jgi:hypothetical protein